MTYIPDLTERYPEPDDSMSGHIEVGQVWENNITKARWRVTRIEDHYIYMEELEPIIEDSRIDLADLKNQWVLIG